MATKKRKTTAKPATKSDIRAMEERIHKELKRVHERMPHGYQVVKRKKK